MIQILDLKVFRIFIRFISIFVKFVIKTGVFENIWFGELWIIVPLLNSVKFFYHRKIQEEYLLSKTFILLHQCTNVVSLRGKKNVSCM